jgi:hypothetical protein
VDEGTIMADILNQDELDALLDGIDNEINEDFSKYPSEIKDFYKKCEIEFSIYNSGNVSRLKNKILSKLNSKLDDFEHLKKKIQSNGEEIIKINELNKEMDIIKEKYPELFL